MYLCAAVTEMAILQYVMLQKNISLWFKMLHFIKNATQLLSKYLYTENIFTASINSLTVICIILTGK